MDADLLSAGETCRLLGISQATLYAYVSRGLLESRPGADHRSRAYRRQDVEKLLQRKREGRGAARGAAQSLDRGLPVMETRISLIRPDGPYYRGRSAVAAVRAGATLEDTARLLWDCGDRDPFVQPPLSAWPAPADAIANDAITLTSPLNVSNEPPFGPDRKRYPLTYGVQERERQTGPFSCQYPRRDDGK